MLPAEGVRTSAGPPVKPREAKLGQHYTDIMAIMAKTKPKRLTLRLDHYPRPFIHSETLAILIKHQTMSIKLWVYRHISYISTIYQPISTIYQLYIKYQINIKQLQTASSFGAFHYLTCLAASGIQRCADPLATCGDTDRGFACARRSGGAPIPVSHHPSGNINIS